MALCTPPVNIRTFDRSIHGLRTVTCLGDGASVLLNWNKAYTNPNTWLLVYNLYWSSEEKDVFSEGVKFVVAGDQTSITISGGFKRGEIYYFAVEGAAHEPGTLQWNELPEPVPGLRLYPEAALREDITATDLIIPVDDASQFPSTGIILIHAEPIQYSNVDLVNNNLLLSSINQRGWYGYQPREHTTDGWDGYHHFDDSFVRLWKGWEDGNTAIGLEEIKFEEQYAQTPEDGYRERKDIIAGKSNLDVVEQANDGFPAYDQTGWDRTFMPDYLAGKCVGTYFGGEYGCSDGYESDGGIRGLSVQDHMNMREEYLLQITGKPVVLFKRMWQGKESRHFNAQRENTIYRGLDNYGTTLVSGYEQYFNPRRSDGRILVRFGPTKEDLKREDAGIENTFIPNCWIGTTPTIQDGDFFIRFNQDGTDEWRYEIIDVERNDVLLQESGLQKFTAVRLRKTDPMYQVRAIRDTSMFPHELLTGIGMVAGPGGILPHMHRVVVNEHVLTVGQINQMTSVDQGHNHTVINGIVQNVLGHTHTIILP
jgi:hypothetical protein